MTMAVAFVNLLLGTAYVGYGVVTAIEMKRDWRTVGFSHFGAAWITMAFTCGPHHLAHGIHLALEGRTGGSIDLFAVILGLPAGVLWLCLRTEAFFGGRGDRFISGTPWWMQAMPTVIAVYVTGLVASAVSVVGSGLSFSPLLAPNIMLIGLYLTIGYILLRTQLMNRAPLGGWSASGISLTIVFPTCALMHAVFILYATAGAYHYDIHGFAIDWLGVPAAAYFLWVVHGAYRGRLDDRNRTMGGEKQHLEAVAS